MRQTGPATSPQSTRSTSASRPELGGVADHLVADEARRDQVGEHGGGFGGRGVDGHGGTSQDRQDVGT